MGDPSGFSWTVRKSGEIVIDHNGRRAAVLRGLKAAAFREDVTLGDEQDLMARITGNYKHGNERAARNHPRNG